MVAASAKQQLVVATLQGRTLATLNTAGKTSMAATRCLQPEAAYLCRCHRPSHARSGAVSRWQVHCTCHFQPRRQGAHSGCVPLSPGVLLHALRVSMQIYEVQRDRAGAVTKVAKSNLSLKGHRSQVTAVAFSPDAGRAVTASKDGSIIIWNLQVRYELHEDAKPLAQATQVLVLLCYVASIHGQQSPN